MKKILLILLLINGVFTVNAQEMTAIDSAVIEHTQKFRTILETAIKNHKDSVDIKKVSEAAYSAMLKAMDPYSDYFTEEVYQNYKSNYYKTVRTVGISLTSIMDTLFVIYVRPDSPADSAGIRPGDKIIYLDGVSAIKMDIKEAEKKLTIKDTVSTPVNLVIKRYASPGLNEYFLTPKEMPIVAVTAYFMLPGTDIGYIKSKRFPQAADSLLRLAIKDLKKQGAKKIIFDMRGHYGGQVKEAADIVDEFVPAGKTITYIEGKNNHYYKKYISEPGNIAEDMPLILLVDKNTMSAAEIVAGAIQDLDRGILVGDVTYGKGMAQKTWSFKDGSAFRLTIGDYYTPTGRNIQRPHDEKKVELDPALKLMLKEGNVKDIENLIEKFHGKTHIETYTTPKGRIVFGGGGIMPDYFVKPDTTTLLTRVLKSKSIIVHAVFEYLDVNRDKILDKYGNNFEKFNKDFVVSNEMLREMEKVSRQSNIWNEKMFQQDMEVIRNFYKSLIAYFLWGNDGFYLVEANKDKVLLKGIEYMPKAVELIEN